MPAPSYPCGHWTPLRRGRHLGTHRNPGLELVLVLNGAVTWDYAGTPVHVEPRHLSFSWPWQRHGALGDHVPPTELLWVTIPTRGRKSPRHVALDPALGLQPSEARSLVSDLLALEHPVVKASPLLCQLLPRAVASLERSGHRLTLASRGLLLAVLAEIQDQIHATPTPTGPGARARTQDFLGKLTEYCEEIWTLERMAKSCGLGRTHFSRWVKELTGDTPIAYLNRQRVERAAKMLHAGGHSVTDVAYACGFQSSQYFATVYRAFKGHAPSEV